MASLLKRARQAVRRLQYLSGLKDSRMVRLEGTGTKASFRAVVLGLPEEEWAAFAGAFPEYEMFFARDDAKLDEIRLVLSDENTALIAWEQAPRRLIQRAADGQQVPVFHASPSPIPYLKRPDAIARGYSIDTMGNWRSPRRPTEFTIFLESFDLTERPRLLAAARHLLEMGRAPLAAADGSGCLLLPTETLLSGSADGPDEGVSAEIADLKEAASAAGLTEPMQVFLPATAEDWSSPDIVEDFLAALENHPALVTRDHPLGLLALLLGHPVTATAAPFWAGYGLSRDLRAVPRRRSLNAVEMVAVVAFLLSRYVDDGNRLIDPAEDWMLPGRDRSLPNPVHSAAVGPAQNGPDRG